MASHATYPGDNFVWMSRFADDIKVMVCCGVV
nr:MAG TPA: hypothetical protein [Caudoviricetes sp.]